MPAVVVYSFVAVWPNLQAAVYSFTNWDGIQPDFEFVGFANYAEAVQSPYFGKAFMNTLVLTASVTFAQLVVGLLLALALHTTVKTRAVLRVIFFAPVVLTSVAVGYIWSYIFQPNGSLNELLRAAGLGGLARDWLGDPSVNLFAIAFICVWQSVGMTMVIFLAGLEGIDAEVLEASHLDGATSRQRFWHIVRPLLAPALFVNGLLCVIGGLRVFDQIFVTTRGGPAYSTSTLATLIYTDGFAALDYSYAITLSIVLAALVGAVTAVQFRLTNSKERE